jgi:YVTN family beta-propeller protein
MTAHNPPGPPARPHPRRLRRRTAWSAALGLLSLTLGVAAVPSHASDLIAAIPGVGGGPQPIDFSLTDAQGSWFDTGLDLTSANAGQSLAVAELPRVGTGSPVSAAVAKDLLNADLAPAITNARVAPTMGTGVDTTKLLNLDRLRSAVAAALGSDSPKLKTVDALISSFTAEMSGRSIGKGVNLTSLPSGQKLMSLLTSIGAGDDVASVPVTVNFHVSAPTAAGVHTATSLIWPEGAEGFPFDQSAAWRGDHTVQLTKPGLYAFACKIHPYMLGAIVVDDPLTPGLDFGKKLVVNSRGLDVPSNADVIQQLVQKFFTITEAGNWAKYSPTAATTWDEKYPPAPILMYDSAGSPVLVPSLDAMYQTKFAEPHTLPAATQRPKTPGVGEVWVDTQMEKFAGKEKSGAATMINASTWKVSRKVALPQIDMNNPHNMWADKTYKYIYQTEWFSDKLDMFERTTGKLVRRITVGPDPSHVMTRTDTDQMHVALNGGNAVVEVHPYATKIDRVLKVEGPGEKIAHPHAHWMSGDAKYMVTPNVNTYDSTVVNIKTGGIKKEQTGELPIASGMMPDASKYYLANFLGQSVSCISLSVKAACHSGRTLTHNKIIDLWAGYDPISGKKGSTFGGLPIQIPVSPDGNYLFVANTLSGKITVISTKTDQVVKELPCDAGCHGINFGAKKGGGYYAYVSSKFANVMSILDGDPNGDGNPADAAVVGKIVLDPTSSTALDSPVTGFAGMGGQGVLALPIVYNGWSQHIPRVAPWNGVTCRQRNPITWKRAC